MLKENNSYRSAPPPPHTRTPDEGVAQVLHGGGPAISRRGSPLNISRRGSPLNTVRGEGAPNTAPDEGDVQARAMAVGPLLFSAPGEGVLNAAPERRPAYSCRGSALNTAPDEGLHTWRRDRRPAPRPTPHEARAMVVGGVLAGGLGRAGCVGVGGRLPHSVSRLGFMRGRAGPSPASEQEGSGPVVPGEWANRAKDKASSRWYRQSPGPKNAWAARLATEAARISINGAGSEFLGPHQQFVLKSKGFKVSLLALQVIYDGSGRQNTTVT